jgi:hypothetical protein
VIDVFVSDWVVVMRWEMRMRAVLTGTIGYLRVEEVVQAAMLTLARKSLMLVQYIPSLFPNTYHRHFTTKRNVHVLNDWDFGATVNFQAPVITRTRCRWTTHRLRFQRLGWITAVLSVCR